MKGQSCSYSLYPDSGSAAAILLTISCAEDLIPESFNKVVVSGRTLGFFSSSIETKFCMNIETVEGRGMKDSFSFVIAPIDKAPSYEKGCRPVRN